MKKKKLLFSLYAILSIGVITSQILGIDALENILKPLLMPYLMLIYVILKTKKLKKYDFLILTSLFFSMMGDSFLMPYFNIFMAGLGSFLLAHILYLAAFSQEIEKPMKISKNNVALLSMGFIFLFSFIITVILSLVKGHANNKLIIAIGIYAGALFSVFVAAVFRNNRSVTSYYLVLIGAGLFLLSDGLLALNKFVLPIYLSELWIMSSYTSAQAFLMMGALQRIENRE